MPAKFDPTQPFTRMEQPPEGYKFDPTQPFTRMDGPPTTPVMGGRPEPVEKPWSFTEEVSQGVQRGVDNLQAGLMAGAAVAADIVGADESKKWWLEKAAEQERQAGEHPSTAPSFTEIKSLSDVGKYGIALISSQAPNLAAFLIPGGVVGKGAQALGAAPKVAAIMGRVAGTGAMAQMEAGHNYLEAVERGKEPSAGAAAVTGIFAGLLENVGGSSRFISMINKFGGDSAGKAAARAIAKGDKTLLTKVVTDTGKMMVEEGAQEVGQEMLSLGNLMLNDIELHPGEAKERLIESGAAGAFMGGAMGPIKTVGEARAKEAEPAEVATPEEAIKPADQAAMLHDAMQAGSFEGNEQELIDLLNSDENLSGEFQKLMDVAKKDEAPVADQPARSTKEDLAKAEEKLTQAQDQEFEDTLMGDAFRNAVSQQEQVDVKGRKAQFEKLKKQDVADTTRTKFEQEAAENLRKTEPKALPEPVRGVEAVGKPYDRQPHIV